MSYTHTETHTFRCDRCDSEETSVGDINPPDKWVNSELFGDGAIFHLCPSCVANLARWFEPPDVKRATRRPKRAAKK